MNYVLALFLPPLSILLLGRVFLSIIVFFIWIPALIFSGGLTHPMFIALAWILIFLYAAFGLIAAVFVGLVLNHALNWIEMRRRASRAPAEKPQNHSSS